MTKKIKYVKRDRKKISGFVNIMIYQIKTTHFAYEAQSAAAAAAGRLVVLVGGKHKHP